ncbi:UNVERIFIED_CONTAM: hypothetical protein PYX00_004481 [Menopon gallinae]|uniref:Partner of bursicon n=1 Tax=Menopon gallinae TaxID=328185 RepID=A0AAW2I4M6_9NEOP
MSRRVAPLNSNRMTIAFEVKSRQENVFLHLLQACCLWTIIVPVLHAKKLTTEREELCETLPSEIHIIKEEFDELGRLQRTCNGEVAVNKCDGACNSQVQPSVITPTGFLKECYCCRESFLRERVITLSHCYDPDGIRITQDEQKSMDIKLKEPNECKCFKCGDFSR